MLGVGAGFGSTGDVGVGDGRGVGVGVGCGVGVGVGAGSGGTFPCYACLLLLSSQARAMYWYCRESDKTEGAKITRYQHRDPVDGPRSSLMTTNHTQKGKEHR